MMEKGELPQYELVQFPKLKNIKFLVNQISYIHTHMHPDLEVAVLLSGRGIIKVERKTYSLKPGDVMLINFSDLHSYLYDADTTEAPTYLILQISDSFLKDYFPNLAFTRFTSMPFLYSQKLQNKEIRWLINLSLTYFERKDNYGLLILAGISYLLYYIYRWTPYKILTSSEKQRENSETKRIEEMLSLIHQNFDQKIHLEDLAKEFHLTRTYVSSLIKNNLGISFQEYLNNLRFEKATQLMFDTKKSLLDISYESGFSDPKYMSQVFQKRTGCSPSEFRNHMPPSVLEEKTFQAKENIFSEQESIKFLLQKKKEFMDKE